MSATMNQEMRSSVRVGVRTPVVVYSRNKNGNWIRSRAWTDDLSIVGARITSEVQLDDSEVWLRIMLPDLKDQVIQSEVVREVPPPSDSLKIVDIRRSYYGIRFVGLADELTSEHIEQLDELAFAPK